MTISGYVLQSGSCWGGGQGGMGPGWGMGGMGGIGGAGMNGGFFGGGGLWSLLWFVLVLGVLALGIYLLVTRTGVLDERDDTALATLRERYARGEIETEEYEQRVTALSRSSE